jgi:hypothetical protein
MGAKVVEGFEEYPKKHIHEQLKLHLDKRVTIWAAGRSRKWSGILIQVGLDYVVLGQTRKGEIWKRQYFLLNQIVSIEPS